MITSEPRNTTTTAISEAEYLAAKRMQYAAEERDAKETPKRWPSVVSVTNPENGKKVSVYTNVEWQLMGYL